MINQIKEKLFSLQDNEYKEFNAKLIPNINPQKIIGVRIPVLRKLAKELRTEDNIGEFLKTLPHEFFEENMLHILLLNEIAGCEECVEMIDRFLPFVDNWAVCDSIKPKAFKKNTDKLISDIEKWLCSKDIYAVRFGIGCLMTYYLDSEFKNIYLEKVSKIKSKEYYINMMIAWYFATALAKQWDSAVTYIEQNKLPKWVHNKTIQKAVESYRITQDKKEYLKRLKI